MITSQELKKKYLEYFAKRGHAVIPSASLIPENDPTVLFTTAGMHPLVPYLSGQTHPAGKRLTDVQKCIRTGDIDDVGDNTHLTFFEMLGNWSLGDYWKTDAIKWSFEFLTQELGVPIEKLAVTCFAGDDDAPRDTESAEIWQSLGIPADRIYFLPKADNWWGPAGQTGPCGPDTEMFYWTGEGHPADFNSPAGRAGWVEIWNDVFMEYFKNAEGKYEPSKQRNVDTGMGVERTTMVLSGKNNVFEVEPLATIVLETTRLFDSSLDKLSAGQLRAVRIIADHLRAATFMLAEGLEPSNVERGYVLRRLIRRSVRYGKELGITDIFTFKVAQTVIREMSGDYPELKQKEDFIINQLIGEEEKFKAALEDGLRMAEKVFSSKKPINHEKFVEIMQAEDKKQAIHGAFEKKMNNEPHDLKEFGVSQEEFDKASITGEEAFYLYQSFGLPIEMISELARERNLFISKIVFDDEVAKHQELSRTASAGKFKGGLADHSEATTKLHTATHLLNAALRQVLGSHVYQKGSNITAERLRFDFVHPDKLTDEQIKQVETIVNDQIKKDLPVSWQEVSLEEAKKLNAIGVFEHKYAEQVKVYTVGDPAAPFSREICGGPHVEHTGVLGEFKIKKEESSSAGIRRIKAVLA